MRFPLALFSIFLQIFDVYALIIPDEYASILPFIYDSLPVVKKGTDSRIGWGFRLGERADFQILVELGPQIYTQRLANQEDDNTNGKRNVLNTLSNRVYAQRLRRTQLSNKDGGKWLEMWSRRAKQQLPKAQSNVTDVPGK